MNTNARPATRCALVTAALLGVAALTGTSAAADSGEVEYSCEFGVADPADPDGPGERGEGTTTASFDTAIPDGLVVDVGDRVDLDPFTGTITLPEAFVTMLRDPGSPRSRAAGARRFCWSTRPTRSRSRSSSSARASSRTGSPHLAVEGDADRVRPRDAGVHSILLTDFGLFLDTGVDLQGADMSCRADDDVVVDTFGARATPAPTVTVTAAPPVRPVVVQTDFAGRDGASPAPALAAGACSPSPRGPSGWDVRAVGPRGATDHARASVTS